MVTLNWGAIAAFLTLLLLPSHQLAIQRPNEIVIWNVGQGQWVSRVEADVCTHLDMGGERAPWRSLLPLCRGKKNRVHFTHADWDHIGMALQAQRQLGAYCVVDLPREMVSGKKLQLLRALPLCANAKSEDLQKLNPQTAQMRTANDFSEVYLLNKMVLVPGDSPAKQERWWSRRAQESATWLVLGHHGSRYSTSEVLLSHWVGLRAAIASARRQRYNHPNPDVIQRLRRHGIPTLSTEEWGNIHIRLE